MARPEEKAQAMLNKWVKMKGQGENYAQIQASKRRPYLASLCEHLHDAETWRRQIVHEISSNIGKIQNPGLGEHALRDLNDTINKSLREKWHWNRRIKELGGRDFNRLEKLEQISEGDEQGGGGSGSGSGIGLKGSGGYRYFGAAKELPGVKEMFARNAAKMTKRKRGDVYKYITPDYYGLRDEDDGILLELEELASAKKRQALDAARADFRARQNDGVVPGGEPENYYCESDDEPEGIGGIMGAADAIAAHVAIPTENIVARTILERKKKELLASLQ